MLKGERCATPKCPVEKRSAPAFGRSKGRRRNVISDRGLQLREKQKVRYSYGVLERQFRRFFAEAKKGSETHGDNLLILLERRLDNVVYRLGFADSRAQARQVVCHGHIAVNGRKTDIPSFIVKAGDIIKWRDASMKTEYYKRIVEEVEGRLIPNWLSLDKEGMAGTVAGLPTKDDVEPRFNEKAVVGFYSR
jgi:small subunit ribosomal protein S4